MAKEDKQSSPLAGWVGAGADLVAARLAYFTEVVNTKINASHELLDELQHRGEAIDAQLRMTLKPSSFVHTIQDLIMTNPLRALVPGLKKSVSRREQKLALLSAKVDLLVEQVALLAAKQALEKKRQTKVSSVAKRKTSTAKKVAENAESGTTPKLSGSAPEAKKTTTRRASATRKTTASRKSSTTGPASKASSKGEGDSA
ncbi:hypothetical protein DXV75_13155 [Alteromonas aestuariivivens]|uniref:Uncharacterized protein n=1 Tax=Alteromonas aestuariivivens TaxID=1938339 RepID=A0A3D8M4G7_9ALTE|nr:hypothetical protein [Alteromonas aestuariivivens]RDV24633.1 hypothetical protein DXV75_13155 [Alteromonas aestuariivivens]